MVVPILRPSLPGLPEGGTAPKHHLRGTHRQISPAETLRRVKPWMSAMGITRIANLTGLDTLGLPVAAAYRPNSRSIAVSQGKGMDLDSAKASALMESIESFHAEHVQLPLRLASARELGREATLVDLAGLPRTSVSRFHPDRPTLWVEGDELMQGGRVWVPFEMVHTNFSLPLPTGSGSFMMTSNGLASGNHLLEAISHGICELVERDANALWGLRGGASRVDCRVDPDSLQDPDCRAMLARFEAAGVAYGIWETTSDIRLPAFLCIIADERPNAYRQLYYTHGSGCHCVREIALMRALTEAAQTRLTCIAGTRDDGDRNFFEKARNPDRVARVRAQLERPEGPLRDFKDAPTWTHPTFEADVLQELDCLMQAGLRQVVAVDLSRSEFGVPVVRVIIPGLESLHEAPGYLHGARARAAMQEGQP